MSNEEPARPLREVMADLAAASARLNTSTDEMTKVIEEIEAEIDKLRPGLNVWVMLGEASTEPVNTPPAARLGYGKYQGKWGILVKEEYDGLTEIWPISRAPRWMRIRAVIDLSRLIEAMLASAIKQNDKVLKRTITAAEILDHLKRE